MPLYVVVKPDDDNTLSSDTIREVVEDVAEVNDIGVWVVKSPHKTCGQLADALGIGPSDDLGGTGLVFKISASDGFFYSSFWDQVKAMEMAERG